MERGDSAAYVHCDSKDLLSLMALVLRTPAPLLMLSYTWKQPFVDLARSLASAVPNAWIDVQALASGVDIGQATSTVSRWSFAQVVFLSPKYLTSKACLLEFFTALLKRQEWQHLIVYWDRDASRQAKEDIPEDALGLLKTMGCKVVFSAEQLVQVLDCNIYGATEPDDFKAVVEWWSKVGVPREDVPSDILLPAPKYKNQPFFNFGARAPGEKFFMFPPSNAIVAGNVFISSDGRELGRCSGLGLESILGLSLLATLIFTHVAFFVALLEAKASGIQLYWGVTIFAPVLLTLFALLWFIAGCSLSVLLDMRRFHSPLLLPLNVAACVNDKKPLKDGQTIRYVVSFIESADSADGLEYSAKSAMRSNMCPFLDNETLPNLKTFLAEHVGLEVESRNFFFPAGQPPARPAEWDADNAIRLVVFFIRSVAAAKEYIEFWQYIVPPECSVLVANFKVAEAAGLNKKSA